MARPTQALVAIVASGPVHGVRDVLTDWSALGLIAPFFWLEAEAIDEPRPRVSTIDDGLVRFSTLPEVLSTEEFDRIRICVLVPAMWPAAAAPVVRLGSEDALVRMVRTTGEAPTELIRLVLPRSGAGPAQQPLAREGWHNLVLSPEDGRGPRSAHDVLPITDDPLDLGAQAAAALAGVLGLWTGVPASPLDELTVVGGEQVRVVRSFYRRLDASELSDEVRRGGAADGQ